MQAAGGAARLARGMGLAVPAGVRSGIGAANDVLGIANAFQHPTFGSVVGGVGSSVDLYSKAAPALGLPAASKGLMSGVGALGDIAGIANAIKNPTPGNIITGGADAYKLYGTASSAFGAGTSAGTAALPAFDSSISAGLGSSGAASGLGSAITAAAPVAAAALFANNIYGMISEWNAPVKPYTTADQATHDASNTPGQQAALYGNSERYAETWGIGKAPPLRSEQKIGIALQGSSYSDPSWSKYYPDTFKLSGGKSVPIQSVVSSWRVNPTTTNVLGTDGKVDQNAFLPPPG